MVNIIGAGLAGCEAAYQLSKRGIKVKLFDCKPITKSAAHHSDSLGELVCSNSLKSDDISTASGLLKAELRELDCLLLKIADSVKVPAGSALAVDRILFSKKITDYINSDKNIEYIPEICTDWDANELTIIATGPMTLSGLSEKLSQRLGNNLYFYDAAAPIVSGDSIDYSNAFVADRYGKGNGDYVNCPMNKEEYSLFYEQLIIAERSELHDFETNDVFESCMPVEIMAKRGFDTLRFGPMRPIGFKDENGKRPFAVVQLRRENVEGNMFNIVGFQTNLKFGEQKRVFGLIPALKNAEFLRYGVMHRNIYVNAPTTIDRHFVVKRYPKTLIAGQLSGVEGYVESIMSGLVCGINAACMLCGKPFVEFPSETIIGSLCSYLERENVDFQPMNANFGILPQLLERTRDKSKNKQLYSERSLKALKNSGCLI